MKHITTSAAVALVAVVGLTACEREPLEPQVENPPAAATDQAAGDTALDQPLEDQGEMQGEVRVADIVGEPEKYIGRTVTVTADLEEVYGPRAFALDEDALLEGGIDNDLMVLSREAGTLAEIDDQWMDNKVRVTGQVGVYSVVEVEREIGWDLDPQIEAELEEREPVLIATSIERIED